MGAGAPVLGLAIGGPIVDLIGWRWIFGIQPPLAAPGLLMAIFVLRPDRVEAHPRFDVSGSLLLGLTMGSLLYGINRGAAEGGWSRIDAIVPLVAVPFLMVAFVAVELSQPEPLLHLEYFRRRNVTVPILIQVLGHVPYMGTFFLVPFLLQEVLRYDNTRTALVLLPRPLSNSLMSAAAGYLAVRIGERSAAVGGMLAITFGLVLLAQVGPGSGATGVVVALVLTGAGMGLSLPGLVSSVANSVSERDFGAVSAAQEMMLMVGMVTGMQGMQTLQAARARVVGPAQGYQDAFLAGALIAAVALVLAFAVRSMHRATPVPPTGSPEAPMIPEPVGD
jgi:predicted MFS family arabinose efflux permease